MAFKCPIHLWCQCRQRAPQYSSMAAKIPHKSSSGVATRIFFGSSLALFAYYQYKNFRKDLPPGVTPSRYSLYRTIPTNLITKVASIVSGWNIPKALRRPVIGGFARMTGCRVEEAERPIDEYASLGEFFSRRLRAGARSIDDTVLVSPADCTVMHLGSLTYDDGQGQSIEQVKNVPYSLGSFLSSDKVQIATDFRRGQRLYYATLYLAPSDYHRFHSPCEMRINESIPVKGEALPVAPWMMNRAPGLLTLNARHVMLGRWSQNHPIAVVPVGATSVRSIVIDKQPGEHCTKGEELGHFKMGSSIVLIFEAPEGFQWQAQPGSRLRVGEALGDVPSRSFWSLLWK